MHVFELLSLDQMDRLALVLLHSVWQTALIAGIAALLVKSLWNGPSHAPLRYVIETSALASILLMPMLTWIWVSDHSKSVAPIDERSVATSTEFPLQNFASPQNVPPSVERFMPSLAEVNTPGSREVSKSSLVPLSVQQLSAEPISGFSLLIIARRCTVLFWLVGVGFFSLRLLRGLIANFMLQRNITWPTEALLLRIQAIAARFGWRRTPRVAVSDRVQQAVVTGYFRSIVLLPLAWTTQLPSDVLDAVIAHELAHLRRFDTWGILLQRITETLLFFHPAVWWLSGRISYDRELCCDELAARATGCTDNYAAALEHMGRLLQHVQPAQTDCQLSPGLGGQKMELLHRIKHVLALPLDGLDRKRTSPAPFANLLPVLWVGLVVAVMRAPVEAQVKETGPPANPEYTSAPAKAGKNDEQREGVEIRTTKERVHVELSRPATLNDAVMSRLKLAEKPIMLTIGADVEFSPDEDLARLISVPHLVALTLESPIEDRHVQQLANLKDLESLHLERSVLSRAGVQQLAKFPRLRHVGLQEMDVNDGDVRELLKLESLRGLQFGNCKITPAIIPDIARTSQLTSVNLRGCPLRAGDVSKLSQLPDLQMLYISSVAHDDPFTGDAILSACSQCQKLKYLNLEGVTFTVDGLRRLNAAANLHNLNVTGTIGPLFYPKVGPAYLKARELRFAALYTTERSYFGGSANWSGTRFTLDAVYHGELMSQAEYLSTKGGNATEEFPPRIPIRSWQRGMTEEDFATTNGQHSPRVDTTDENEEWASGNPTRLHYAMVVVTAKWNRKTVSCRGVTLGSRGLVAVPTELFREHKNGASDIEISVVKEPLEESFEAEIVGRHGPITLVQSDCSAFPMPISFRKPSTGDKVFAVEGVKWNDHLAIVGILSGQESVIVPPTLESFSNEPVEHADLIVSNLPQSQEFLGTPLANESGELIGLCLPLRNSDGRGYAISVAHLRDPLNALAAQAKRKPSSDSVLELKAGQFSWPETEAAQDAVVTVRGRHREAGKSAIRELVSNGIIVDPDGQILTTAEAVNDAESVSVEFGGEKHVATVIGIDDKVGLALLKIKPVESITALNAYLSPKIQVGDSVAAIARTHTFPASFSQKGILSAIDRTLEIDANQSYDALLQFDFAIQHGSGGAPLVDSQGILIGVIINVRAGSEDIGFAIPVRNVVQSVDNIRKKAGLSDLNSKNAGRNLPSTLIR